LEFLLDSEGFSFPQAFRTAKSGRLRPFSAENEPAYGKEKTEHPSY
jgi:hypothetical protein